MQAATKPLTFIGSALDDLRDFPRSARRAAGFQPDKVQQGENPDEWKPMTTVGSGVCEIRVRDEGGAFRVVYVAKFSEAVYVLHSLSKEDPEDFTEGFGSGESALSRHECEEEANMKTFASVWDAIEDSRDVAEAMKARAEIMRALQKVVGNWGLSQKAAAAKLGVTQPRLNDLLRGKIDKFSLDALFDLAGHTGLRVSIALKRAA